MEEYEKLGIYQLRILARQLGVKDITLYKKSDLIDKIKDIVSGKTKPYIKTTKQGRPAKNLEAFEIKDIVSSLQITNESYNQISKELKSIFINLRNFNSKVNVLIDNFLEKFDDE